MSGRAPVGQAERPARTPGCGFPCKQPANKKKRKMKILVTGAAGFIGHHLTRALLAKGAEVVGIDSLNDYYDVRLKLARLADLGIAGGASGDECRSTSFPQLRFRRMHLEDREGMALSLIHI